MKKELHPEYKTITATCACGNKFETRSTTNDIHLDICNLCHPFFSGTQKLVDTDGRVDKFRKKFGDKVASSQAKKKTSKK